MSKPTQTASPAENAATVRGVLGPFRGSDNVSAHAALDALQAQAELWRSEIERVTRAEDALEAAEAELEQAREERDGARKALRIEMARAGSIMKDLEQAREALRQIRVSVDPVVHGGSFDLKGAQARLKHIEEVARAALAGDNHD